jgi:hypothetical protein
MKLVRFIVRYMSILIYPCDVITGEGNVPQEYNIIIVLILIFSPGYLRFICHREQGACILFLMWRYRPASNVHDATFRHCLYPIVILSDKGMMEPATCVKRRYGAAWRVSECVCVLRQCGVILSGCHEMAQNVPIVRSQTPLIPFCFLNRAFRLYMRGNQQMHKLLFNLLVMYGGFYTFRHYIAILRERS